MHCAATPIPRLAWRSQLIAILTVIVMPFALSTAAAQSAPKGSQKANGANGKGKESGKTTAAAASTSTGGAAAYYPPAGDWRREAPAAVGMDGALLDKAIAYSKANENPASKDLAIALAAEWAREPFDSAIGPTQTRAALNGLVIRRGSIVAEWGDTRRPDMTFSITKTFLSTIVGLAVERGLIHSLDDKVVDYMPVPMTAYFETPHNAAITWDHMLRQTSDWRGTIYGKPDWADRPEGKTPADYPNVPLREPGTFYEYNDARVNLLSLATLNVWRRPLPSVLREQIMEPIGASSTWRWHGYDNSWVELDGQKIQSVSGGGHWGAGMFISAHDLARFGYLFLHNGKWGDRQLVSEKWIGLARTPGSANAQYGFMNWFLNTKREPLPHAPESSVTFRGAGNNIVYIDWEHDLIVVVRWIRGGDALDTFIGQVLDSIAPRS
jgi:CubicO group peptidase (beta-lactamase class C family)